jgi:hypothetical protein
VNAERLAEKYIASAEHALGELKVSDVCVNTDVGEIEGVVGSAKAYLEDARYYSDKREFKVSLTSVAYCEGLLDALRMLGMVKFEWPVRKKREK